MKNLNLIRILITNILITTCISYAAGSRSIEAAGSNLHEIVFKWGIAFASLLIVIAAIVTMLNKQIGIDKFTSVVLGIILACLAPAIVAGILMAVGR